MSDATPACRAARTEIVSRRYVERKSDGSIFSFFPLDRLRDYLLIDGKVEEILQCKCGQCREDRKSFEQPMDPLQFLGLIVGENDAKEPRTTSNTAFSLFSLLIYIGHPIFIIGFVQMDRFDVSLELYPEAFLETDLAKYTGSYASNYPTDFDDFTYQFTHFRPQFAVRHMNSGRFSRYPAGTILPFVNEQEIGKQWDPESGQWINIGANGRVFAFEIYNEYRNFSHESARKVRKFARKRVETIAWLEKANLEHTLVFNDKHIVKLIKAYSLGGVMNLIFPLAKTNLDELLRDLQYDYATSRAIELQDCDAWKQLLGISKALSKIAGVPSAVSTSSTGRDANGGQWFGFHFDLKPANILIEDDGTWVITDFGQATFTYSTSATPRVAYGGGTDAYAPPEIDNVDPEFRRRYDVWSLGCIFLEVATFLVLGYSGLKGCDEYEGLDRARKQPNGWSNGPQDSRFFYQTEKGGEYKVKPSIVNFMGFLRVKVADRGQETQKFLAEILQLIEMMLEVDVEKRKDIGDVILHLDDIILRATSKDNDGEPLQIGPGPNEVSIGAPELGMVKLWHLNEATRQWQAASLQVFEDMKANLRFNSLATPSRTVTSQYMRRHRDEILPHYAFFDREKTQGYEPWISFANNEASEIPGAMYWFSKTADAHLVQSLLTYQNIETSFPLADIRVKKYIKISRIAWAGISRGVGKIFNSKNGVIDPIETILLEGKSLGPANVQLWTELEDQSAARRKETQSLSTGSGDTKRKPRVQYHHQNDYRPIYPRRVVIYLQKYGYILTLRTNVNWKARLIDGEKKIHFKPTDPERDPHFVVSLLCPSLAGHRTGLPLCPNVLGKLEEESRFEADLCELVFTTDADRAQFNTKYRAMKQKWAQMKKEVEEQQGYMPIFGPADPYGDPTFPGPSRQKVEPISPRPLVHHDRAPSIPQWDFIEGVPPAVEQNNVVGKGKGKAKAVDVPKKQLNDDPKHPVRADTFPPAPPPTLKHKPTSPGGKRPIVNRGGGGRGRPPKGFEDVDVKLNIIPRFTNYRRSGSDM